MENSLIEVNEEKEVIETTIKKRVINVSVGNDNGNSEHDIIINGDVICQPNVYAKVDELPMLDEITPESIIKKIESNLIVTINSPSCSPSIYYIGNYALTAGEGVYNMEVGILNDKTNSEVVVINTLGQIAGYAVKKEYEDNKKLDRELLVNVDMTAALPVKQYTKEKADKLQDKFTNHIHQVTVHVGNKRVNVEMHFFTKVLPEAVPATFAIQNYIRIPEDELSENEDERELQIKQNQTVDEFFEEFNKQYAFDEEKNPYGFDEPIDGRYFKKKKILHIGIGEGTTEYPLVTDISFNPQFIHGTDNGVGHAINKALKKFGEEATVSYTRQDYSRVIRDKEHKYHKMSMKHLKSPLQNESAVIFNNATSEVQRAKNEVDVICVHGGGSILMKEHLYHKLIEFGNKTDIKVLYVPAKYAVTLEALGMYVFTNSNIFKKIKEKYLKENDMV